MSRMWASDRQNRRRTTRPVEGRPTCGGNPHAVASAGLPAAPMASFPFHRVPSGTPTTPKADARRPAHRLPKAAGSNRPSRPWLTKLLFLVTCFSCCVDPHDDEEDVYFEDETAFPSQPAAARPAPTSTDKAGHAPIAPSGAGDWGPTTIPRGGDEARPQYDCLSDQLLVPTQEDSFGDEGIRRREASDAREAVEETSYSPLTSPDRLDAAPDEGDAQKKQPIPEEPSPTTSQDLTLSDASPSSVNADNPLLEVAFPSAESLSAPPSSPPTDLEGFSADDADEDDVDSYTSGSSTVSDGPVVFSDMSDDEGEEPLVEQPDGRPFDKLMSLLSARQEKALTQLVTKHKAAKQRRRLSYTEIFAERAVTMEEFSRTKYRYNIATEHGLTNSKARNIRLAAPFPQHLKRLGDGGVGVLYVVGASQGYDGDRALKRVACFPSRQGYTPAALANECMHEAEVCEKLIEIRRKERLEHLVLVHRYTLVKGGLFLEMELLRGGDLSKLRNRVLDQDSVVVYIAATVGYVIYMLAAYGIMHHDLSLTNVMFNERGQTKLIDLGHWGPAQVCVQWGGTKDFQAPEVKARKEHNFLADMYSLGFLLSLLCRDFRKLSQDVNDMMDALKNDDPHERPANMAAFQALPCFASIEWSQIADGSFPVPQFLADHAARMASEAQED